VSHACNPSYSGSRDPEDHSLKPARANSSQDPISKTTHCKTGLGEWPKWKELLLSKYEALMQIPVLPKKKKKQIINQKMLKV
jgi:hypothetical protein